MERRFAGTSPSLCPTPTQEEKLSRSLPGRRSDTGADRHEMKGKQRTTKNDGYEKCGSPRGEVDTGKEGGFREMKYKWTSGLSFAQAGGKTALEGGQGLEPLAAAGFDHEGVDAVAEAQHREADGRGGLEHQEADERCGEGGGRREGVVQDAEAKASPCPLIKTS